MADHQVLDVAIIGGGPAGLTASLYLARFLRSIAVFDAGDSRAALIPLSKNFPGFPEGISGEDLLRRLRRQATDFGVKIVAAPVEALDVRQGTFTLWTPAGKSHATYVILATGIVDKAPAISGLREGISTGAIRFCPVCDGYEVSGQRIGIVGEDDDAIKEAIFLRRYSPHIFILANYPEDVGRAARKQAADADIEIWDIVDDVAVVETGVEVRLAEGSALLHLDVLYCAMGCEVRSELATNIGADCDQKGFVSVGPNLETSVPGLYAIGDVAQALNQIVVGCGHAAIAAADINNALRGRK